MALFGSQTHAKPMVLVSIVRVIDFIISNFPSDHAAPCGAGVHFRIRVLFATTNGRTRDRSRPRIRNFCYCVRNTFTPKRASISFAP